MSDWFRSLSNGEALDHVKSAVGLEQNDTEMLLVLQILHSLLLNVDCVLELGIRNGGSMCMLSRIMPSGGLIVGVDYMPHSFKKDAVSDLCDPVEVRLVYGDTHETATRENVITTLGEKSPNILHVDADHQCGAVMHDVNMYGPLIKKPGIIIIHDITMNGADGQLEYLWDFYRKLHSRIEIVIDPKRNGYGIMLV